MCYNGFVRSARFFPALRANARPPCSPSRCSKASRSQMCTLLPISRQCNSFSCNTYASPACVANKRLMPRLNPLDATLTKNTGGDTSFDSENRHPTHVSPLHQALSFQTLARSFALMQSSTLVLSITYALFAKTTGGGGSHRPYLITFLCLYLAASTSHQPAPTLSGSRITGPPRASRGHQSLYHFTP
jgi:hypothetical protein